jgi:hypothetical protein
MAYICTKKPIILCGVKYLVGDEIPDTAVARDRENSLLHLKLIAKQIPKPDGHVPAPTPEAEPETDLEAEPKKKRKLSSMGEM